jgi:DNA-binding transcriptional MerR regulator
MEYTVNEFATISGVSVRTLHYYDEIGLLHQMRVAKNGYRIYGQKEVDLLQQILFYRELGVPLKKIIDILNTPNYDKEKEFEKQLSALLQRKIQIEHLITNVKKRLIH